MLILKRNYLRDELMQAIGVMMLDSRLDDEKIQPATEVQPIAEAQISEEQASEQTASPAPKKQEAKAQEPKAKETQTQVDTLSAVEEKPVVAENVFVDLGLPSGTLWKSSNEEGLIDYNTAKKKYKRELPSVKQWKELKKYCEWQWADNGYRVTGPNGTVIFFPAAGYRNYSGKIGQVGKFGNYWSSTPKDAEEAWRFGFEPDKFSIAPNSRAYGRSVRLVKKQSHVPDITDIQ
ncbi:MAG: hypothetical protein IJT12_02850 [Paludibacteraceae bacterium]|nr:hypothetical protein [Paludibacteraceae bacterium]